MTSTPETTPGASVGASPTETPCITLPPPPPFTATLTTDPLAPKVGDQVTLTFAVHGGGGIPQFTLKGTAPVFAGAPKPLYEARNGILTWRLEAANAGVATLLLDVIYETPFGCVTQQSFVFSGAEAGPFMVTVSA